MLALIARACDALALLLWALWESRMGYAIVCAMIRTGSGIHNRREEYSGYGRVAERPAGFAGRVGLVRAGWGVTLGMALGSGIGQSGGLHGLCAGDFLRGESAR